MAHMKIINICKHCLQTKQLQQLLKHFFASSFSVPCIMKFSGDKAHLKTTTQNFQYDVGDCPDKYQADNVTILYKTQNYFSPIFSSSYTTIYITKWIRHNRDISSFHSLYDFSTFKWHRFKNAQWMFHYAFILQFYYTVWHAYDEISVKILKAHCHLLVHF